MAFEYANHILADYYRDYKNTWTYSREHTKGLTIRNHSQSQTGESLQGCSVSFHAFPHPSSTKVSISQACKVWIIHAGLFFRLRIPLLQELSEKRSNVQFNTSPHQFKIVSQSTLSVLSNSASNKIKPQGFKTTSDRLLQSLIRFIGSK